MKAFSFRPRVVRAIVPILIADGFSGLLSVDMQFLFIDIFAISHNFSTYDPSISYNHNRNI